MSALQVRPADGSGEEFRLDHTPTSMRAIRDGIAAFRPKRRWRDDSTGPVERTREHHIVGARTDPTPTAVPRPATRRPAPDLLPHRDASIGELAAGTYDLDAAPPLDRHTDDRPEAFRSDRLPSAGLGDTGLIPLAGRSSVGTGLDPLVMRLLLVGLVVLLAIPLALALRDDTPSAVGTAPDAIVPAAPGADPDPVAAPTATTPDVAVSDDAATVDPAPNDALTTALPESASAPAPATAGAEVVDDASTAATSGEPAPAVAAPVDEPAPAVVDEIAERLVPDCSLTYTAGAGDSWYRIADEAGVAPAELLGQNSASTGTVILPGDEICLPPGATVPTPPTTTVAPTTTAVSTTAAAPTTTAAAPTTTAAPTPVARASTDEVQAMIRETFPADQVDKALDVAWRESRYRADADNGWCCVGVFQIYWTVHRSWLDDYGISSRDDLKDARKNITAAYALYQRAGGWGPWSTA